MKKSIGLKKNLERFKDDSRYKAPQKEEIVKLITEGALLFNEGRYNEAIGCYEKALQIDPTDSVVLSNMGGAYVELKKYDVALSFLEKSIGIDPDFSAPWYNKAACLSMLGENEEALNCLEKAVTLDPKKTSLAKTDPDFSYIRQFPRFSAIID
ncbi:tetratricopeptide repeat protein [Candidatus Nitrosotenuis cloacae]|uniref:tetratricopeptide repeat protein n=1 Tax=Candidatus Nitrosotenuis cloacae TaxID=1603555 RepID=UPI00227EAE58|nr:tetratricopeptide repeat protein [Candidatus Nitrosotenuis cloacae]